MANFSFKFDPNLSEDTLLSRELEDQLVEYYDFPQHLAKPIADILDKQMTLVVDSVGKAIQAVEALPDMKPLTGITQAKIGAVVGALIVCGMEQYIKRSDRIGVSSNVLKMALFHTRLTRGK